MKLAGTQNALTPVYVLATGTLGSLSAILLFSWNYPDPNDPNGAAFQSQPEYWIWVFLFGVLFAMLATFLVPAWLSFFAAFRKWAVEPKGGNTRNVVLALITATALILGFLVVINVTQDSIQAGFREILPEGHSARMWTVYFSIVIVLLPIALVILLLHYAVQQVNAKIQKAEGDEARLFSIVEEVLDLREILQNHLLVAGITLSMVPLLTSGLRAVIAAVDQDKGTTYAESLPLTIIFVYGLVFSLLLIFIYVPTHLALTDTSRRLRDSLSSISSMTVETLKDRMEERENLDTLLQTQIGLGQNLKTGFVTLTPLITSLVVSLIGIEL